MLHVLISCSFYSHSLNLKTRKLGVFRKPTRPSLPLKKEFFLPLRLSCKESSTFLTKPLFPQGREDVTALRCSEPLRYKVGGASKPSPCFAGWDRMGTVCLLPSKDSTSLREGTTKYLSFTPFPKKLRMRT